MEMSH